MLSLKESPKVDSGIRCTSILDLPNELLATLCEQVSLRNADGCKFSMTCSFPRKNATIGNLWSISPLHVGHFVRLRSEYCFDLST